ncbi:MAG: gas vesicle protein GvpG [Candidatus Rokuibacteriota bacterium]
MIILDSLLLGGLRFVLGKIAQAVDAELNDAERLREELLAAQMRVELGEMTAKDFAVLERQILARLRELRGAGSSGGTRVTGVEARAWDDD